MASTMGRRKDTMGRCIHQAIIGSTMVRRKDDKKEGTSLEIYAHELAFLPIPKKPWVIKVMPIVWLFVCAIFLCFSLSIASLI